jgi:hypothetical protein
MNFAHSRVITRGPNAGLPKPITDIVIDGLFAVKEIAVKLKRQQATVIGIDIGSGLPTVQIMAGRASRDLVKAGVAACHKRRIGSSGAPEYHWFARVYTDEGREVRVIWIEQEVH